ncbi:MAG TPA: hypothetical protein VNZ49_15795 [Bacteroidia bacterium]|nr:hypothetical protein [Bacteroidia bacterium]
MKKIIIGVTAAIMLAGTSVYAANTIGKTNDKKSESCCCKYCGCPDCVCGTSCGSCCGSSCSK